MDIYISICFTLSLIKRKTKNDSDFFGLVVCCRYHNKSSLVGFILWQQPGRLPMMPTSASSVHGISQAQILEREYAKWWHLISIIKFQNNSDFHFFTLSAHADESQLPCCELSYAQAQVRVQMTGPDLLCEQQKNTEEIVSQYLKAIIRFNKGVTYTNDELVTFVISRISFP